MAASCRPDWTQHYHGGVGGAGIGAAVARTQIFHAKSMKDMEELRRREGCSRNLRMQNAVRCSLADFVTQTRGADAVRFQRQTGKRLDLPMDATSPQVADFLFGASGTRRGLSRMEASSVPALSAPEAVRHGGVAFLPMEARSAQQQPFLPPWVKPSSWDAIVTQARKNRSLREGQPKDGPWKEQRWLEGRANPPFGHF